MREKPEILKELSEATLQSQVEALKIEVLLDIRQILMDHTGQNISIFEAIRDFSERSQLFFNAVAAWAVDPAQNGIAEPGQPLLPLAIAPGANRRIELDNQPGPPDAPIIHMTAMPGVCLNCGKSNNPAHRFCSFCGVQLPESPAPGRTFTTEPAQQERGAVDNGDS